jgi:small subunit ribosomal protein S10e
MSTLVPKKTRDNVYRYLFTEGVCVCKKDPLGTWTGELGGKKFSVPSLQVWALIRSMKSRGLIKEQFAWRHFYWTLNDNGVTYLRKYLHLAETVVPETHKKSAKEIEQEREREKREDSRGRGRGGRGRGFGRGRGGFSGERENYQRTEGEGRGRGRGRGRGEGRGRGGRGGRGRGAEGAAPATSE